ncbi:hypothetical protein ACOY9F_06335 [Citrobacter portucalensis]|uniref:hypothetical protein n=1 Tax=Citrobacter portucalensis TaxID=1639133 RepID=UPI0007615AFE|nr:hypothetical protein [Citrobacter portucalensis]ATM06224.1 hypothetical protein CRT62_17095 [Raoultella planticola]MBY5257335.1 hypothetical protein [Citrobacter amalonaticus]SAE64345.1 Uncharacterised protein [Enterobacter cloacae]ATM16567.1 hypothetical protein CRN15_17755 [Raoultella planticola]MBD9986687.1 hypothetical protein [Citrobacter portucalensis]
MDEYIVINQSNNKCYNVNELVFDVLMYSTEINSHKLEKKYGFDDIQIQNVLDKIYGKLNES